MSDFDSFCKTRWADRRNGFRCAIWLVLVLAAIGAMLWCVLSAAEAAADPERYAPYREGLVQAGLRFPGAMVFRGEPDPRLTGFAQAHAAYQARARRQGHQLWDQRFVAIRAAMRGRLPTEICAESWEWERNATPLQIGESMCCAWRQSPGHWRVCATRHRYYGAGVALGDNGIWYAAVIVVD